jgi:hypothetical protein
MKNQEGRHIQMQGKSHLEVLRIDDGIILKRVLAEVEDEIHQTRARCLFS